MEAKKEIIFSIEKLRKSISNINVLSEKISNNKNTKPLADEEIKLKKNINYIKKYAKKIMKDNDREKISFLQILMKLSKNSLKNSGDEFLELLWEMYDSKNFHIYNLDFSPSYYDYFLHLFFFNHKNLDFLIKKQYVQIDKENRKIESYLELEKNDFEEIFKDQFPDISQYDTEKILEKEMLIIQKKNFMIDLIILEILCNSQISLFYTSLSSFIINTESNVMLLFKAISLFALCLWNLEKKENFVGSLIYVIGGVLRDHGRSYLKTKGILNENLSYHLCVGHDSKHSHYCQPKILTSKECSYLELYLLPTMKEFLKTIFSGINFESMKIFLDDCMPIYFRYLDKNSENSDEYSHLPEIQIFHYVNLFLSDFLFFFLTNFCEYQGKSHIESLDSITHEKISHRHMFSTKFSDFEDFIDYSLTIINKSFRNVTKLFEISEKIKRLQETECEKTEYLMKDSYNHYGVCMIFYLYLNGGYSPVNLLNEKDYVVEACFLPMILKKEFYLRIYLDALNFILTTENIAENKFLKDYKVFSTDFLRDVKKILLENLIESDDKNFKIICMILLEFAEYEDKDRIKEIYEIVKLLYDALILLKSKEKVKRLINLTNDDLKNNLLQNLLSLVSDLEKNKKDESYNLDLLKELIKDLESY